MSSQFRSLRPSANVTPVSAACFFRCFVPCAPRSAAPFRPPVPLHTGGFLPPLPPRRPRKCLEETPIVNKDASNRVAGD